MIPKEDSKITSDKRKKKDTQNFRGLQKNLKLLYCKFIPSRKLKDNMQNGRKYLQIIYLIRDLYLEYIYIYIYI